MAAIDDYLGALNQPLGDCRLLLFYGTSGSGKSTQLRLTASQHPQFQHRHRRWLQPHDPLPEFTDVLLLDEVQNRQQARCIGPLLQRCHNLLIASHVPPWQLWRWRLGHTHRCYHLDRIEHKLRRQLQQRNVMFSEPALQQFMQRFGANYTELDVVLELAGGGSLDAGMALLQRGAGINIQQSSPL